MTMVARVAQPAEVAVIPNSSFPEQRNLGRLRYIFEGVNQMELFGFFVIALAAIVIAINGLRSNGNKYDRERHGGWRPNGAGFTFSDQDSINHAHIVHHQVGIESSESSGSQSAYDSSAPADSGTCYDQTDFWGGDCGASGGSYDSGGSSSSYDSGGSSSSYDSGGSSSSDCGSGS